LTPGDFFPFTLPAAYAEPKFFLAENEIDIIEQSLWEFAVNAQDRAALIDTTNGACDDLMTMLCVMCDREDIDPAGFCEAAFTVHGGKDAFTTKVRQVLDQTADQSNSEG
jgi:hypothetical protein